MNEAANQILNPDARCTWGLQVLISLDLGDLVTGEKLDYFQRGQMGQFRIENYLVSIILWASFSWSWWCASYIPMRARRLGYRVCFCSALLRQRGRSRGQHFVSGTFNERDKIEILGVLSVLSFRGGFLQHAGQTWSYPLPNFISLVLCSHPKLCSNFPSMSSAESALNEGVRISLSFLKGNGTHLTATTCIWRSTKWCWRKFSP